MFCENCGKEIKDDSQFCPYCGAPVGGSEEPEKPRSPKKKNSNLGPFLAIFAVVLILAGLCVYGIYSGTIPSPFPKSESSASVSESKNVQAKESTESVRTSSVQASSRASSQPAASDSAGTVPTPGIIRPSTETPTPTPTPTPSPASSPAIVPVTPAVTPAVTPQAQHRYQLITENVTWEDANKKAAVLGGYLAHFETTEEFSSVVSQFLGTDSARTLKVWIGGRRSMDSHDYHWANTDGTMGKMVINGGKFSSYWYTGEPSFRDTSLNLDEAYMEMFFDKTGGRWVFNDVPNDIIAAVPGYAGSVAYLVEFNP